MHKVVVTPASSKLAKAQEISHAKGLRAAVNLYIEATDALAAEKRYDAAVGVLAEVLNARERKRGLFGSKEIDPLGPDRVVVAKQFAKLTRHARVNDPILELLSTIAAQNPDDPEIRLANAEGLYRAAYIADAIDEYRYCEKLLPDDGALLARLGELYATMSRNSEAVDHLRRGIGELMQARNFDPVPAFSLKLLEVEPQSANDVQRWLEALPEDALRRQRGDITRILDATREAGLDDGRWSGLETRLAALPPKVEEAEPEAAPQSWESEPEPIPARHTAWDDTTSVEPANEDEMRMLLGPSESEEREESEESEEAAPLNGVAPAASAESFAAPPQREAAPAAPSPAVASSRNDFDAPPSVSIGSAQPTSAGGLPPGLAAFTRRKADSAFTAGDFAGAATSYERLLKIGFDAEVASPLVECYLGLQRFNAAAALGMALADHQAAAGELDKAVATLALILDHKPDATVERRHSELLAASKA